VQATFSVVFVVFVACYDQIQWPDPVPPYRPEKNNAQSASPLGKKRNNASANKHAR
jgi:hypothetical protein